MDEPQRHAGGADVMAQKVKALTAMPTGCIRVWVGVLTVSFPIQLPIDATGKIA